MALWALLPLSVLLIAAVVLLVLCYRRMSRDRANFRVSRDRATLDLQMSLHQNSRRLPIQHQTADELSDCSTLPGPKSNRRAAPPGSLPPGPPSSVSDQSAVEQEVAHVLLSCARGQSSHQCPNAGTPETGAACSGVAALVSSCSSLVPSAAPSHPFCGTADSPMVLAAPTDHRGGMWRRGSCDNGTATGTHPFCGTRSTMARTGRRGMRRRAGYGSTHPFCTGGPYTHLVGSRSTLVGG